MERMFYASKNNQNKLAHDVEEVVKLRVSVELQNAEVDIFEINTGTFCGHQNVETRGKV